MCARGNINKYHFGAVNQHLIGNTDYSELQQNLCISADDVKFVPLCESIQSDNLDFEIKLRTKSFVA